MATFFGPIKFVVTCITHAYYALSGQLCDTDAVMSDKLHDSFLHCSTGQLPCIVIANFSVNAASCNGFLESGGIRNHSIR